MEKQEIINPYELSKDEKLKKQKTFYSKSKAIKYLQTKATHFEVTKKLFKELDQTGRLLPDKSRFGFGRYSEYELDLYGYETQPR
ncbi:hypothetical protein [Ligilactobacillus salivarius]|uniref:hypothetical protein n=1 Tax=Ligilactobacillus salivarius TaxID=1624 RepID=UPI000B96CE15|nr:hypothetical protein [Ligilactobacillus salivarius]OYP91365.1 hypothetical protein B9G67_05420 [Ligilactobacillus salivarius]